MKQIIVSAIMALTILNTSIILPAQAAEDRMAQVQLVLKKMKASVASLKDFDELEKAGLDKRDVNRLRDAMKAKLKQMTTDTVLLIRVL